ncbi:MAG: hypothetical protein AB7F22_23180 [Reyranella sp.]|uniref:hypothetical protein n=1 Tax=Reyranella sp. TaxID=1929291 RepID=UPI003D1171FE
MSELSAEIVLRPTRIGFLTPPTDLAAVRAIMRACTCVWGGVYNPIIPVFKRAPPEWQPEIYRRFKGAEVATGYARFFEPDVYVETKKGLLEDAGFGALRQEHTFHAQVITLKEFLEPEQGRNWSEPAFGLSIHDVLGHIYKTEQQFVRRDSWASLHVSPERGNVLSEAMFGVYPNLGSVKYIEQTYGNVYRPDRVKPTPNIWRQVFLKGAQTPLRVTRHGLDTQRNWHHDLLVFVFDPTRATDLIDLWNLRLEPHPVLPVPVEWFEALSDDIHKVLKAEHRPIEGNPHGSMHQATIEFGRSIRREKAESLVRSLKPGLPPGALSIKYWRNAIWVEHRDDRVHRNNRLKVVARERRADLVLEEDREPRTTFETLVPEFAQPFGKGNPRWVNVLNISNYSNRSIATVLPFNTFDRTWPRLGMGGDAVPVTSEGWVFPQQYTNLGQYVSLLNANDAIVGSLEQLGIKAELSEPGHIARQILEHLGGLRGVSMLAHIETLNLLNKMAGGLRRKRNDADTVEENFELRTARLKDWTDLIAARKTQRLFSHHNLEAFTKSSVIRLGLETDCPHCNAKNWSTLTVIDYRVTCERCLKVYDFPQAALRKHNRNFTYRVIGPFSVPDYGRGSYSALLALRVLQRFRSSTSEMTFSTAMKLSFDGMQREVDFVAWRGDNHLSLKNRRAPQLIIGEAKSLGQGELITAHDLAMLKSVAGKLPESAVVISVLRDHFTPDEKQLLEKFVNWGRRVNVHGEPSNPVLLLTAHELTMDFDLSNTWKSLGGAHARFTSHNHTRTLLDTADATQQIYLGLPSFHQVREKYWDRRLARRKAAEKRRS